MNSLSEQHKQHLDLQHEQHKDELAQLYEKHTSQLQELGEQHQGQQLELRQLNELLFLEEKQLEEVHLLREQHQREFHKSLLGQMAQSYGGYPGSFPSHQSDEPCQVCLELECICGDSVCQVCGEIEDCPCEVLDFCPDCKQVVSDANLCGCDVTSPDTKPANKSETPCRFGVNCRFWQKGICWYKVHNKTDTITAVPQQAVGPQHAVMSPGAVVPGQRSIEELKISLVGEDHGASVGCPSNQVQGEMSLASLKAFVGRKLP